MCNHDFDQRGGCKHCGVTWEVAMTQQPQPDWTAPDGPDEDAELVSAGVIDEQCSDCGGHAEPFVDAYVVLCPPERIAQHDGRQGFVICKGCWDKMIGEVMLQRLR